MILFENARPFRVALSFRVFYSRFASCILFPVWRFIRCSGALLALFFLIIVLSIVDNIVLPFFYLTRTRRSLIVSFLNSKLKLQSYKLD